MKIKKRSYIARNIKKTFFIFMLLFLMTIPAINVFAAKGKVRAMILTGDYYAYNSHEIMTDFFKKNTFGGYKMVKQKHYHYETNQNVHAYQILQKINDTFCGSKDNDIVFFYFGGHGTFNTSTNKGLGITLSSRQKTYYPFDSLARHLANYKGKKYVILDCCYAGAFIDSVKKLPYKNSKWFEVLTASGNKTTGLKMFKSGWDIIKVWKDYPRFTYMLAKGVGIKGGSSLAADYNRNGTVTFQEIYKYVNNGLNTSNPRMYAYGSTILYKK